MQTVIVNHGGIVQKKILIHNFAELEQYGKQYEKQVVGAFSAMLQSKGFSEPADKDNPEQRLIALKMSLSKSIGKSPIEIVSEMPRNKLMSMLHFLHEGHILVVNEAGGWCFWDDHCMKIVDDSPGQDPRRMKPYVNILPGCKVLVIENQWEVSPVADKYAASISNAYSVISNLYFANEGESRKLLAMAIQTGHDTIVAESTFGDIAQLEDFIQLFTCVPNRFNFYLFTQINFRQTVADLIGDKACHELFEKHNIVINPKTSYLI